MGHKTDDEPGCRSSHAGGEIMYAYVPLQRPGFGADAVDFSTDEGMSITSTQRIAKADQHAIEQNAYWSVALGWIWSISLVGDGTKSPYIMWTSGKGLSPRDPRLVLAFKHYQQMKGLTIDGIAGPQVFAALTGKVPSKPNTPVTVAGVASPSKAEIDAAYNKASNSGGADWLKIGLIGGGVLLVAFGGWMLLKKKRRP